MTGRFRRHLDRPKDKDVRRTELKQQCKVCGQQTGPWHDAKACTEKFLADQPTQRRRPRES